MEIGEIYRKIKGKYNINIYQDEREREIIERMKSKSKVLRDVSIESIWNEFIKSCKLLQALEVSDKN
jgi:chorismate mutase